MWHPAVDGTTSKVREQRCFDTSRQAMLLLLRMARMVGYISSRVIQDLNWSSFLQVVLNHRTGVPKSAGCLAFSWLRQALIR